MRNDGAKRRILDRSRNLIEFVLRGGRYISGAVDPIPLRERCALNVVSHGLCRLVDRVRAKIGYRLPNWSNDGSKMPFNAVRNTRLGRAPGLGANILEPSLMDSSF
jgi:hypothetical protein